MRILFITAASHTPNLRDYNHFQRVDFLSRNADLTLWSVKGADFSASAAPGTPVSRARLGGKLGLFLHVLAHALAGRARSFDIVLTEPSMLSVLGPLCKLRGGGKWVVDVWDIPGRIGGRRSPAVRLWLRGNRYLLKQAFRLADLFLLSIRPDYEFAYFAVPADRMLLLKNAIRLDEIPDPDTAPGPGGGGRFNILCSRSSYHSDMGLDTMAQAYDLLRKRGAAADLTIVGRIPDELRPQVALLEGDPHVEMPGFIDNKELKARILRSSVCVVPFRDVPDLAQTYPIKVVEYMAMGKPVIVSDIGGMREMVTDGETGFRFRAGDPDDLCREIETVMRDAGLAARLAANAREAAARFDYKVKGRQILKAFRKLAGE